MLTSTVLVKTSSFKYCVVAPEMFPNYRLLTSFLQKCSSTAEVGYTIMYTSGKECLRQKETYTGTVHSVVDRPNSSTTRSTMDWTLVSSATSTLIASALKSACFAYFLLSSAASWAPCSFKSAKAMPCTPASAKAKAASLPIPAAAYK